MRRRSNSPRGAEALAEPQTEQLYSRRTDMEQLVQQLLTEQKHQQNHKQNNYIIIFFLQNCHGNTSATAPEGAEALAEPYAEQLLDGGTRPQGVFDIILHHIIASYIILYHTIYYYIILYHIISCYIILSHIISYDVVAYHTISYVSILYYILSCYIILYCIKSIS